MLIPNSVSPSQVMTSQDKRDLGIAIQKIEFSDESFDNGLYRYGDRIWFLEKEYNAKDYILSGVSHPEEMGSWTDGKFVELKADLNKGFVSEVLEGQIQLERIFNDYQEIEIFVNNKLVLGKRLSNDDKIVTFDFDKPKDMKVNITIKLPDSTSPFELGLSEDNRMLALMIKSIAIINKTK